MAGLEQYLPKKTFLHIGDWAVGSPVMLEGFDFTFEKHEYLIEPYADNHPFQVEQKCTQVGCTVKALLKAFYNARFSGYRRAILYYFPTKNDVSEFSKGRAAPLIADNPETLGAWVQDTDATHIKRVGNCFIYFRGMKSVAGLKSTPADEVIFDELDEAPQTSVMKAMKRMSHSEFGVVKMLSNPTLPDFGISKAFQDTDQRYWLLQCPGCGHWNCLEDIFLAVKTPEVPRCFRVRGGEVRLVCEKCERELDKSRGQWVAKRPGISDKRGRHYTQLWSHFVSAASILEEWQTTKNLKDFYNLVIGVEYVEAENRLSVEEVLGLCGSEGIRSSAPGPCYMGVDQGKDLHVVIGGRHWEKDGEIVHLGVYRDWEELDGLMKNFRVAQAVVDALPETRNARAFAERHRGKVFLNFYQEKQKGQYAWNERDLTVSCNRTESLDHSHQEVSKGRVILPRQSALVEEFAAHLHNVAKKLEEDEESGTQRYVYVKLGADHFRHAFNYECMARNRFSLALRLRRDLS